MNKDGQDSNENGKGQGQRPTPPTPTSGPPSNTVSGAGPSPSIEQALSQLLNSSSYPLAQNLFGHPSDLLNYGQAFNQFVQGYYPPPVTPNSPTITYADPQLAFNRGENSENPISHLPTPVASPGSSTATITDMGEAEMVAISEEKRRRNTAASARFRIKKKQRTVHLERSVYDLKGRAGELEKEITDLRRENGWLKDIVILKGAQRVAAQRHSQRHLVQNVEVDLPSAVGGPGSESSGAVSSSSSKETTVPENTSSDDSEPEKTGAGTAKKQ